MFQGLAQPPKKIGEHVARATRSASGLACRFFEGAERIAVALQQQRGERAGSVQVVAAERHSGSRRKPTQGKQRAFPETARYSGDGFSGLSSVLLEARPEGAGARIG